MQNKKIKLEDMIPQNSEIKINDKVYTLRKITLADEAWMRQFGDLQKIFQAEDMEFMSKLTFRLLVDKSDFLPMEASGYDDDGEKIQIKRTGPQRILEGMGGMKGKYEWIAALVQTFGMSRPMLDELAEEEDKKKEMNHTPQIGAESGI